MKITIKNSFWEILATIPRELWKTLLSTIQKSWIEIHNACQTWICRACMCNIEKGGEYIDKNFKNESWFPLRDEEVMTCIAWIKKDFIDLDKEIILKTIY